MYLRYLYYALWIAPVPVFVCLVTVLVRRKIHVAFPFFFGFTILQLVDFVAGFSAYHHSDFSYFCVYWTMAALGMAVGFAVLYELFTEVFRPYSGLREFGGILFRWAGLVLILAAVLMAASSAPITGNRLFAAILNLSRSLEIMQCGLVLLMLLCSSYLGLTLHHRIFGIALGFGIIAATDLIAVTLLANLGQQAGTVVNLTKMVAYNISAWVWLGYIYAGAAEVKPAKRLMYAERWDYALASAVNPDSESSALPLIEDVVERVWNETNGKTNGNAKIWNADQ